jgi:arsenical pump membrane protein
MQLPVETFPATSASTSQGSRPCGRLGGVWWIAGLAGLGALLSGAVSRHDAYQVAVSRGGPVLGFLIAITVLSELAQKAGVFDAAAGVCARRAGGSTIRLFLLIAALGTVVTIGMSLDTTAVLLTPVVLTLARSLRLPAAPFAMLAVWLANTASLLLPVSNLTNLLALQREHLSAMAFATRMALPEFVAVVITVGYLAVVFRRDLTGRYEPAPARPPKDRVLFGVCALACLALGPGVLLGAPPWEIAGPCAVAAVAAFGLRDRSLLSWSMLPWRIVILTEGLFLAVTALATHGLTQLIASAQGTSVARTVAVSALGSNAVNNLPAYLAEEPAIVKGHTTQLLGALLGTNGGPLILVWGSLATLLWRERCERFDVHIGIGRFAAIGLGGVPLILSGTWLALRVT